MGCILIGPHGDALSSLTPDCNVELCGHFEFARKATVLAPCADPPLFMGIKSVQGLHYCASSVKLFI